MLEGKCVQNMNNIENWHYNSIYESDTNEDKQMQDETIGTEGLIQDQCEKKSKESKLDTSKDKSSTSKKIGVAICTCLILLLPPLILITNGTGLFQQGNFQI